jgi:outer membrane biosynthesis protein TonB
MATVIVDRRLLLTESRDSLVEDGDPRGAFLWAVAGREMPANEAERLGYAPLDATEPDPEPEPEPEPKSPDPESEPEPEPEPEPVRKAGRPKGSRNKPKDSD